MSSQRITHDIRPLSDDPPDDVLFSSDKGVRIIELNRPAKLNSLNASMIRKIIPRMREWEQSQLAHAIVIRSTSPKAFCAGGDVASIARSILDQTEKPSTETEKASSASIGGTYFALEYQLDHLIATYRQPYIAFMDGITMGGGMGLACHAPFRIATEKTVLAMPETTIGFFPDVGTTFFLPRLDNNIGKYLATTSDRLNGIDALFAGVATHYMHSSSLPDLTTRIGELDFSDATPYAQRLLIIAETLQEFTNALPYDVPPTLVGSRLSVINSCFAPTHPLGIISALEALADDAAAEQAAWARATLAGMRLRSPTSIAVACRQLQLGKKWSLAQAFEREHALARHLCAYPDFVAGVKARLLDKPPTQPEWTPGTLEEVQDGDVEKLFMVGDDGPRMRVLEGREGLDYAEYPWDQDEELRRAGGCGLPRERDVQRVFEEIGGDKEECIRRIVGTWPGKDAVEVKVRDVLARRTKKDEEGRMQWV